MVNYEALKKLLLPQDIAEKIRKQKPLTLQDVDVIKQTFRLTDREARCLFLWESSNNRAN